MKYRTLFTAILFGTVVSACGGASVAPVAAVQVVSSPSPGSVNSVVNLSAAVIVNPDGPDGTMYTFSSNTLVTVPTSILRTAGTALQSNEPGIGIDFDYGGGGHAGQCYYSVDTASPTAWVFSSCTMGQIPGDTITVAAGATMNFWVYGPGYLGNSSDSTAAWAMQIETN